LSTEFGDIVGNPLWEAFQSYELTEIMRQKDDKTFAEALNRLSRGKMTGDDIALFQTRETSKIGFPKNRCVHLYKDNIRVGQYNTSALNSIQEESATFSAIDVCQGRGKPEWKRALLESVKDLTTAETMGLPATLNLVKTASYMLTSNLDTPDGLVNGAVGILKKISYGITGQNVKLSNIAWLQVKDYSVGVKRQKMMTALLRRENVKQLVPIQLEQKVVKSWPGRDLKVKFCKLLN